MDVHAVLIDTVSIQRYIFRSNKLKENLGASQIIQEVYQSHLKTIVTGIFQGGGFDVTFEKWKIDYNEYLIKKPEIQFEIGYIGGGNALLFFKGEDNAKSFVKAWTRGLLIHAPGVVTAVAAGPVDPDNFGEKNRALFTELQKNKHQFIPQTVLPRHGITAECPRTGYSMEYPVRNYKEEPEEPGYVSSVTCAKIMAAEKATEQLEERYIEELSKEYCFTDQLDELGQMPGEDSHIAIVHIDGNGMGERFRAMKNLEEIRRLSVSVSAATEESFRALLKGITSRFEDIQDALGYDTDEKKARYPKKGSKKNLPIRPIIIGGDDITFVCEGRLGIYFARLFLEAFEDETERRGERFSACAGIAVTKTKYPFYRGYALAGQLCTNAKEVRREKNDIGSWLDFHISYGGFSGTLKDIRASHYTAPQGELLFRPYKIRCKDVFGIDSLTAHTKTLKNNFPRSKIMELREVMTLGGTATDKFLQEMKARNLSLPEITNQSYHRTIFADSKTPYFDMIELMTFYPSFELEKPEVKILYETL